MNKILFTVSALLFSATFYAQTDGFWDKERATTKEISLSAGKRALIKTEDLPVGTTESKVNIKFGLSFKSNSRSNWS